MPNFSPPRLREITCEIFVAAGVPEDDARIVAEALVDANLAGHDSHGVIRIPSYVVCIEDGSVVPGGSFEIVNETATLAVTSGGWNFGQVAGRKAMEVAIEKTKEAGMCIVCLRDSFHIGRVGDYPRMAAEAGMVAIVFVNTHGAGRLVAPYGGRERRLAANPIAIAVPRRSAPPLVLDISTSTIAEGKVRTMLNKRVPVPEGCIVDATGAPSTDPADLYGPPEGALLPFGGHKGFGLGLMADILAGALSGAGCSRPEATRLGNSFLGIVLDPEHLRAQGISDDVEQLIDYVKSSALAPGFDEILVPGEPEIREEARRETDGIPVDDETWRQIAETAAKYGIEL